MTDFSMQIKLEGLIKVLAQNLYANPDVFLREMIQNAHDAIVKRNLSDPSKSPVPSGEIRVQIDKPDGTLSISDNGLGLSDDEIHNYLSTIGSSGTGELKEKLMQSDRAGAIQLIGQFGIGLLSAFIVAHKVVVTTKKQNNPAYTWTSYGNKDYTLEGSDRMSVGTTVCLYISEQHRRYLETEHLRSIIRTYADIIGVPVYLNLESLPANEVNAPWHRQFSTERDEKEANYLFWEKRFRSERSLDVWGINEQFTYFDEEQCPRSGTIAGVLGITDRHLPGFETRGTVDLFIARMFIVSGNRDLLPSWATFVQGAVECSDLMPNAARDNVVRNDALQAARQVLGRNVIDRFRHMSAHDPKRFIEIMRWHSYQVMAMCVLEENADFFKEVSDLIPIPSNLGPTTMPHYLEKAENSGSRRIVHYVAEPGSSSQYFTLCEARGINAFDATEIFVEEFLERYRDTWPDRIELDRIDLEGSETVFQSVSEKTAQEYESIRTDFQKIPGVTARLAHFLPREIPALLTGSSSAEGRRDLEAMAGNPTLPTFVREKVKKFLSGTHETMVLNINVDNPAITNLARRAITSDDVSTSAIMSMYNNAVMLHSRNITPQNIRIMFGVYNQVVHTVLEQSERLLSLTTENRRLKASAEALVQGPGVSNLSRFVSCFVAMPFGSPTADRMYRCLESVLEDEPFFWSLFRADETVTDARLWKNVEQQMLRAHCFIAEVSDHNPNVMIEIGRMEAMKRPLLLLRRVDAPVLPVDIRERLFCEYDASQAEDDGYWKSQLLKHEAFCRQRGPAYLSNTLLSRVSGLSDKICAQVAQEYTLCDEFLRAEPASLAKRLSVSPLLVQAAQEQVREIVAKYNMQV